MVSLHNIKQVYIAFLIGNQKLYFKDGKFWCKGFRYDMSFDMPLDPRTFPTDFFYIQYGTFKKE